MNQAIATNRDRECNAKATVVITLLCHYYKTSLSSLRIAVAPHKGCVVPLLQEKSCC